MLVDTGVFFEREPERLEVLMLLEILDTLPERHFDLIAKNARALLGVKSALISMIDRDRQWFKARCGFDSATETPRNIAFCARAIGGDDILVVPDALLDERFADNPLVTGGPKIRFYAGVPLKVTSPVSGDRLPVGTLCVIDDKPRGFSEADAELLRDLGLLAEGLLEARMIAAKAARLAEAERAAHDNLERLNRQFAQAERMANVGSWRMELGASRITWSRQTFAIYGLPPVREPSLTEALAAFPDAARAEFEDAIARTIETGEGYDIEADFVTASGEPRRVRCIGELESRDGKPFGLIGVLQDVTQQHGLEQALRRAAETDELTRLASRRAFNETLDRTVSRALQTSAPLAVLLLDLDNFKLVNDRCGHHAGDELLAWVAGKLKHPRYAGSFAARLGGDEFVLVVTDFGLMRHFKRALRSLLADLRTQVDGIQVSVTIGVSMLGHDLRDRPSLLRAADDALYRAKRQQRGTAAISGTTALIRVEEPGADDRLPLAG